MNDLSYTEWMKFQKSFFRFKSSVDIARESVFFFSKSIWPEGHASRSLIVGVKGFTPDTDLGARAVDVHPDASSQEAILQALDRRRGESYDFIFVDLTKALVSDASLSHFLSTTADRLFAAVRGLLVPNRYCTFLVGTTVQGGVGFPIPWSVALSSRAQLKLRDERIGLVESGKQLIYSLIMQAADDTRLGTKLYPADLQRTQRPEPIPAWIIPKPPPRKKGELLHPAKFPETLVGDFIRLFTKPGDNVFDPMVGTGSTVVAALRLGRNGYGLDLSSQFVDIGKRRAAEEMQLGFFNDSIPTFGIVQGNATALSSVSELKDLHFQYAVTSPPYWSMLSNPGSENQEARRRKNLPLVYSDDDRDLGNVREYDRFLDILERVYGQVSSKLTDDGCLTVIVKNVKREHVLYPLAWDLMIRLCRDGGPYEYLGSTLWCQDDVGLKPFAVGIHWVSNILHHYCLHMRKKTTRVDK